MIRSLTVWLLLSWIVSLPGGLVLATQRPDRNIVLFITDDESPTLGCYGDPVAATPHADGLARDGVLFTHAFATTASCSASRSVVMSGIHNHKNGQYGHQHHFHKFSAYPDVVSLAFAASSGWCRLSNRPYRKVPCGTRKSLSL